MDFASSGSLLASGSWDGTLKVWDIYANTCTETMEHGCDVLALAFRPDGQELCTAAANGLLYFWDTENGTQTSSIEGRRDISGGRLSTDTMTADNAARSKHFTAVAYTADGACIIAGGHSKYVCIYAVATGTLMKKFQMSHNRSLDGVLDELRSDRLVDGVSLDNLLAGDSDDEYFDNAVAGNTLPGSTAGRGSGRRRADDGSRTTRPTVLTSAVRFSPSGREWAAATTQGLQIFTLDDAMTFAPTDLDIAITPQSISAAISREEFGLAVNMALHLGESDVLKRAVDSVDASSIELVVKSIDVRMMTAFMRFLAEEIVKSRHIEYYLSWSWATLRTHGQLLQSNSMPIMESLRAMIRYLYEIILYIPSALA